MLPQLRNTQSHYINTNRQSNRFNQIPIFQRRQRLNNISNCVIEKKRGFRPSDRFDPLKKEFLLKLSRKFWCKSVRINRVFCDCKAMIDLY